MQHTERRYEEAFENARKPVGADDAAGKAGGAGIDREGLRQGTHSNISQVLAVALRTSQQHAADRYIHDPISQPRHRVLCLSAAACVLQSGEPIQVHLFLQPFASM